MKGLERIQQWWKNGVSRDRGAAAYDITCSCGQVCHGQRRSRHQVVRCTGCRREMFVLPSSPLPAVVPPGGESSVSQAPAVRQRPWLIPLVAAGVTLVVVVLGFAILLYYLVLAPTRPTATSRMSVSEIEEKEAEGRKALAQGIYSVAAESLATVIDGLPAHPQSFPPAKRREITQLHRQATILADWQGEPLDKILASTATLNEDNWRAVSAGMKGKTAVLDLEIRRDASRQYHVNLTRPIAVARLRLEVHNLKMLEPLRLEAPQRVIFAARIADIRREERNAFTVRFEPESGVLLTDVGSGIVAGIPEATFQAIIQQQRTWVGELP